MNMQNQYFIMNNVHFKTRNMSKVVERLETDFAQIFIEPTNSGNIMQNQIKWKEPLLAQMYINSLFSYYSESRKSQLPSDSSHFIDVCFSPYNTCLLQKMEQREYLLILFLSMGTPVYQLHTWYQGSVLALLSSDAHIKQWLI